MRVKQMANNGNVAAANGKDNNLSHRSSNIKNWLILNNTNTQNAYENIKRAEILRFNSNSNNVYNSPTESTELFPNNEIGKAVKELEGISNVYVEQGVCNRQYRLNAENNLNFLKSCNNTATANLEGATESFHAPCESFQGDGNVSSNSTPIDEERAFDHSDTDEMSENAIRPVPRGIVNPNYPGFQHLAHTLQDYSSNIENFYPSENDMTDDDIDIEITETTCESESDQNKISVKYRTINNNNINDPAQHSNIESTNDSITETEIIDSYIQDEMPDLLKTITATNNNIETIGFDVNCSDIDIENNFNTKDIIGDFNKEIEDEIKQLLNYNINIEDDLEELRKDIKDTFTKPIENTINNISEVVNHVIKKLVETQSDEIEQSDNNIPADTLISRADTNESSDVNKENDSNTRTEMSLSRPTFLLIENNTNNKITDAFLSDGKDEINIYDNEYDTEHLSNNVENTIKQLSTELRKIIPKLDEMRERDRLWNESKKELDTVITDDNSNEIASSLKCYNYVVAGNPQLKNELSKDIADTKHLVKRIETRSPRDQQKESTSVKKCSENLRSDTSVRKNENIEDCDLGSFDVYNIETALPKLDFDAIENHLKAAKEAERRKRNDREEIRRRLAMGADTEEYYSMGHIDRPGKKPSLHSRLQNGMNLQICFMNETASDNESQASDIERNVNYNTRNLSHSSIFSKSNYSLNNHPYQTRPLSVSITKHDKISTVQSGAKLRPSSLTLKSSKTRSSQSMGHIELKESDFYALQATLQTEARIALAQAKEMARIQMERERRSRAESPVTEMLRRSMQKASAPLAPDRRRVSRQLLTDMNIAQLQVIVNELHSQIESLNDTLVKLLMARDELHMGQDSMLVDIEDLTRYLGVKEQTKKTKGTAKGVRRLTSLVHK